MTTRIALPARNALRALRTASAVVLAVALGACSTVRTVDTSVTSFAGQPAAVTGATYRFEKMPSHNQQPQRTELEAMAENALAAAGLKRDDSAARYSVEVSLQQQQYLRQPPPLFMTRRGRLVTGPDGTLWVPLGLWGLDSTVYHYQLRLVMRDTATAQVSYETSAELESPWSDTVNVAPALLKAALSDYPQPPSGSRKLNMELGNVPTTER